MQAGIEETHALVRGIRPTMDVEHVDINVATDLAGDIALLLLQTVESQPARGDLWLMLFDVYRTQGNRVLFRRAASNARALPVANQAIDWGAVEGLWNAFNEGEPLDQPPEATSPVPAEPAAGPEAAVAPRKRRLGDVALGTAHESLERLAARYRELRQEARFHERVFAAIAPVLQRPTPLVQLPLAVSDSEQARVLIKREDSRQTTPEFENAVVQASIAKLLQKSALLCSNEFKQHSLAVARVAEVQQMPCTIFLRRQDLRDDLSLLTELTRHGARIEVTDEEDARTAALRYWASVEKSTHFVHSLGAGPYPYALLANDFHALLGHETLMQYRQRPGIRPMFPVLVAATQSRADSIGFILPFLREASAELVLIEPDQEPMEDREQKAWSGAYRERRREHAWIKGSGRVKYPEVSAQEGTRVQQYLRSQLQAELALHDARAVAYAMQIAPTLGGRDIIVLVG